MKILSRPEGEGLLTNAEVLEWLKDKNFTMPRKDVPDGIIKPPSATSALAKNLRRYLENSPSGAQTSKSARLLFERLEKFNLSAPELMMIANIRPDAYAHLTALIADVYSRFDEDQIYEILGIVNNTLEKRVERKPSDQTKPNQPDSKIDSPTIEYPEKTSHQHPPTHESAGEEEISPKIIDMTTTVHSVHVPPQRIQESEKPTAQTFENGIDATVPDHSMFAESSTVAEGTSRKTHRRASR